MSSLRGWLRRHQGALFVGAGAAAVGYILYRTIHAHCATLMDQEKYGLLSGALLHEADAQVEAQLQSHFENIQRIADSTTLPSVWPRLKDKFSEIIDLSALTIRLRLGKEGPKALSSQEKMQLWRELKILSFTRTTCAMWAGTLLHLFVRVQLNILGRHVYIDTARGISKSIFQEQCGFLSRSCQHKYIAFADFLPQMGLVTLIPDIQTVVESVLISKSLKEPCSLRDLHEIFTKIHARFKESQTNWLHYLLPEDNALPNELAAASVAADAAQISMEEVVLHDDARKLNQLLMETRAVLSSNEFRKALAVSLDVVLDRIMEELSGIYEGGSMSIVPIARLLPPVASVGNMLLEHPAENTFIRIIGAQQELQSFCAMVYSSTGEV